MIGKEPQLQQIASTEAVDSVDLRCYESLDSQEAEQILYNIDLPCSVCERSMRLIVSCSATGVRSLAVLLRQREVQFLCASCTRPYE
uniref:Protein E7 n=1 Tax=Rousettus bat papillomavirus TaxID=3141903 RepID=A0AAU7E357_9PAPI